MRQQKNKLHHSFTQAIFVQNIPVNQLKCVPGVAYIYELAAILTPTMHNNKKYD
jgi:hypothetical protein